MVNELLSDDAIVKLGGHADSIGPYVYNWHLSKSRADEVKSYLVSKGVDETRISSTEFGNTQPIASNETAEGRQKNRRVEIEVVE
ncbi:OmpA family protein [Olivibacter sp. SDN3]|nr:OmpA family protein [Olivibacter sp. SDN3]